jgi:protein gp37
MKAKPKNIAKGKYWDQGVTLVQGCTKVSPGCENCWSETMAARFHGNPAYNGVTTKGRWNGNIRFNEHLLKRFTNKNPKVFSIWNDLFHPGVTDNKIEQVFDVIEKNQQHLFLILTKRSERLSDWGLEHHHNVRVGVTAENQKQFDLRVPNLLDARPFSNFVSIEPMLEKIDITDTVFSYKLDWIVVGGESGLQRRPCDLEWIYGLVRDARAMRIPIFIKQLDIDGKVEKDIDKFPKDLQIREFPK